MSGNDIAIRAEHLSKHYQLGTIGQKTFRDELVATWHRLRGRDPLKEMGFLCDARVTQHGLFKALNDVSFEIPRGEAVGLVGRNGAGKSTCLKILSRITTPTAGTAEMFGRVGTLLEVGTGFHPELTGRDNIFLNGVILGMKRSEVQEAFDRIVEFADIGPHLDTPVKRYSSGMYVRLAFSVAAHLRTEILLIDEVLAVGDQMFRNRSLERMKEIAASGRTILFVSHSESNIRTLCRQCLWFEDGRIRMSGTTDAVMNAYAGILRESGTIGLAQRRDRMGSGAVTLQCCEGVYDPDARRWTVQVGWKTLEGSPWIKPRIVLGLCRAGVERTLLAFDSETRPGALPETLPAEGRLQLELTPDVWFPPDVWNIDVALYGSATLCDRVKKAGCFTPTAEQNAGAWLYPAQPACDLHVAHRWTVL